MGERGPRSVDALMVPNNLTRVEQRPDAPYDLTDDEADEWRAQVSSMPADHYSRGNYPLLTSYCRQIVAERTVARIIAEYTDPKNKKFNFREYAELLAQQRAQSAAIMRLARSMRLTQQSVTKSERTHHPRGMTIVAPWSRDHEE